MIDLPAVAPVLRPAEPLSTSSGKRARVFVLDGRRWYLATDLARAIEHTNPSKLVQTVNPAEVMRVFIAADGSARPAAHGWETARAGERGPVLALSDLGAIELLATSRKPAAIDLRRAILAEQHSRRRSAEVDLGRGLDLGALVRDPAGLASLASALVARVSELQASMDDLAEAADHARSLAESERAERERIAAEAAPAIEAQRWREQASASTFAVREVAKLLEVSERGLIDRLLARGWVYRAGSSARLTPSARALAAGYMVAATATITARDGAKREVASARVTSRGLDRLRVYDAEDPIARTKAAAKRGAKRKRQPCTLAEVLHEIVSALVSDGVVSMVLASETAIVSELAEHRDEILERAEVGLTMLAAALANLITNLAAMRPDLIEVAPAYASDVRLAPWLALFLDRNPPPPLALAS